MKNLNQLQQVKIVMNKFLILVIHLNIIITTGHSQIQTIGLDKKCDCIQIYTYRSNSTLFTNVTRK
jgi:hypothetical protein